MHDFEPKIEDLTGFNNYSIVLAFPGFSAKFRSQQNCGDKSPKFRDTYCLIPRKRSRDNSRCSNFRSELSSNNSHRSKFRGDFSSEFSFFLSILQHFWAMFCCIRNSPRYKPSLWCGCAREKQLCVCSLSIDQLNQLLVIVVIILQRKPYCLLYLNPKTL